MGAGFYACRTDRNKIIGTTANEHDVVLSSIKQKIEEMLYIRGNVNRKEENKTKVRIN